MTATPSPTGFTRSTTRSKANAGNARYWYAKSPTKYDRFADPKLELEAIRQALTNES